MGAISTRRHGTYSKDKGSWRKPISGPTTPIAMDWPLQIPHLNGAHAIYLPDGPGLATSGPRKVRSPLKVCPVSVAQPTDVIQHEVNLAARCDISLNATPRRSRFAVTLLSGRPRMARLTRGSPAAEITFYLR